MRLLELRAYINLYFQKTASDRLGLIEGFKIMILKNRNEMSIIRKGIRSSYLKWILFGVLTCFAYPIFCQDSANNNSILGEPGIIGTIVLGVTIVIVAAFIVIYRVIALLRKLNENRQLKSWGYLKDFASNLETNELKDVIHRRKSSDKIPVEELSHPSLSENFQAKIKWALIHLEHPQIDDLLNQKLDRLSYQIKGTELGSNLKASDSKGLIVSQTKDIKSPVYDQKQYANFQIVADQDLVKVVLAYIATSVFWLLFGTFIGLLLGVKFILPDLDSLPFLSFGRIRPVHTNTVFWGWTSLAMIGLGYFVVARTSNSKIFNKRWAWIALILMNVSVAVGTIALMSGVNNGGGEYREFIWPIMALFAVGLILTFANYYKMVANRATKEIYISNWYIFGACIWTIVLTIIGYLPFYQEGLGETIIQGYYMHQGVGMWFMTFTLGLVYYYLPSALNKPIYSYSLGILAFWTQMLFYTLIGTHHFVFSPVPWWLQTVAIVFSAGMFIPVLAGTMNFLLTMKGSFNQIGRSYVLPFMLVGVMFYFIGSTQGSFQAFRFTNFVWHFTDFNVAHSHMTMYGIVSFFIWGCIYAIIPKLIGKQPNQLLVGVHFWLSFIGLIAYTFALMIGGTLKGLSWIEGAPFIESVALMVPYWLWRAIGGSFMFFGHLVFWYNIHKVYSNWKGLELEVA